MLYINKENKQDQKKKQKKMLLKKYLKEKSVRISALKSYCMMLCMT